ncbi:hypothetical protein [Sutcliffiella horikoshii]|uniref:hypothetical protein n=1 Tax=Sutcliffiella horikoshii TaxID=79883 RepID=UPI001CFDDE45|nr:hypothetical protein [Sutcliffiella horikoshii]
MKKGLLFFLICFTVASSTAHALSWAYKFVVWEGGVYEVTEEVVEASDIGKKIGEVKRMADDRTGSYYGDASNFYEKGTKYYAIDGIDTGIAIAVEEQQDKWVKAIYLHETPFHWTDILPYILLGIAAFVLFIVLSLRYASKKEPRNQKQGHP